MFPRSLVPSFPRSLVPPFFLLVFFTIGLDPKIAHGGDDMVVRCSLIAILVTLSFACKDEGAPPPEQVSTIQLSFEDASCTEAWLKASTTQLPATLRLLRDGQPVSFLGLGSPDSLVIDEGLLPNHVYTYQLQKLGADSSMIEASSSMQVTTMDTTSHDFQWQTFVMGDGNGSGLNDVVIVNDTLVYACGNMNIQDSLGQWEAPYGLAIWDGARWRLQRLYALGPTGVVSNLRPRGVFAFSGTDVWFASGGVFHWDGQRDTTVPHWINVFPGNPNPILLAGQTAEKLWVTSSRYLFAVGNGGGIAFYNSTAWQRIEGGVTAGNMVDAWGYSNEGSTIVFCVGGTSGNVKLLSLSPAGAHDTLSWSSMEDVVSIWTMNRFTVYVGGVGIWRHRGSSWQRMERLPSGILFTRVRGGTSNNIFAVGSFGTLVHWNGTTWRQYGELPTDFRYQGLAVSQNMVVAVGFTLSGVLADKAAVVVGKRVQ